MNVHLTFFLFSRLVMDTWQYFFHRFFHTNQYLYRSIHSVHHRLYVPYAFGALYNHWLEGILLDTLGAAVAHSLALMSMRQAILLFTIATLKTVDDHCGYSLPFDPFQLIFPNNAAYHDIHHRVGFSLFPSPRTSTELALFDFQIWGIKYNFSQPFFIHWDVILNTRYLGAPPTKTKHA
jgi:sphinganine C4-monooxygenase